MSGDESETVTICGVRLTHPDRVLFPAQGATKRALAEYYEAAGNTILAGLADRPLTLVRCPDGRDGDCFYQKHANASVPKSIGRISIREQSGNRRDYLRVTNVAGLVGTAQIGALELHIWGSRCDRLERPERIVFDLDPDEELPFARVRAAATQLRDLLASLDLRSFALLTGGKGIHVVVPVRRTRDWQDVKAFASALAEKVAAADPESYVATASKAKRRGRIFIDWLRNERGATAIAPWSPRAREGAPVATPVNWNELDDCASARKYTLDNIRGRLEAAGSLWPGYDDVRQSLTNAMLDALVE